MKILLTGATGFIGSYLIEELLKEGWEVTGLARRMRSPVIEAMLHDKNFRFIQADLQRGIPLKETFDCVVHTAARLPADGNGRDKEDHVYIQEYIDTNICGLRQLIEFALGAGIKKVIYLSSVSIYGEVHDDVLDENSAIVNPSGYGISKYMGELMLKQSADRISSVALRLPGVIGLGAYSAWPAKVLRKIFLREEVGIYNPDALFNNMIHLSDLSLLIRTLIKRPLQGFDALTLGCEEPLTIKEIVDFLVDQFGSTSNPKVHHLNRKSFVISYAKAKTLFGFSPLSTKENLERYVAELKGSGIKSGSEFAGVTCHE